ncbi:MAG: PAC2 family protein [Candidatus Woesearchaeota archaeon]
MEIKLTEKPVNPTIIEGFPGFGLIGTIVTEFLIDHCDCPCIGRYWFEELPASIAIHDQKLINPIGIFYNKKNNILIVHSISGTSGIEWKAADIIVDLANRTKAKELICIEGVGTSTPSDTTNILSYTNNPGLRKKLDAIQVKPLTEGIILGVTSAIMLKTDRPTTCFFAETHSALPDSKAAAKVIEVLDKYLGLKVDYKPLLKQAEKFEEKLKGLMESSQKAMDMQEKKQMNYVG